jgi:hypothetical protein
LTESAVTGDGRIFRQFDAVPLCARFDLVGVFIAGAIDQKNLRLEKLRAERGSTVPGCAD